MANCSKCGASISETARFCQKCGQPFSGLVAAQGTDLQSATNRRGLLEAFLKDVEFGPANRKMEAVLKIRSTPGVQLDEVRSVLEKALATSPNGSDLKFYIVCSLAFLGDDSDSVIDVLLAFLSRDPYYFERGEGYLEFPWITREDVRCPHPELNWLVHQGRKFSILISMLEAFGQLRGNLRAATAIAESLKTLQKTDHRLWAIYASGANGNPTLRPILEYYRDREPGSVESQAAVIALERFGTSTVLQLAEIHGGLAPGKAQAKTSGCFIATAVYGSPEDPSVIILRNFRDQELLSTRFGTACASLYYWISPPIADLINRSESAKATVRRLILQPSIWCINRFVRPNSMTNRR
jgi:hypothetical protein